ncbi:MAG: hypothetical protein IJ290_01675 [Bacteroidaceae bacterium]|nr:hypothetical protein [Bacteroidaceae bacterium]
MRYRLATYRECKAHREWNTTCPDCGRTGKFSPYIDTVTMRPVDDRTCGRCNRLSNCGYHLPPREMLASPNPLTKRGLAESAMSAAPSLRGRAGGEANEFYEKMRRACEQSQPWGSHLVTWLRTQFPRDAVAAALKRYRVGGTPDGATLWWQIDEQGRVHTGKAMLYNPLTGHRVKEQGFPVNWAHRMRLYGEPSELVAPQCLFGLSLLNTEHTDLTTDYTDFSDSLHDGSSTSQEENPSNPRNLWSNSPWSEKIGLVESEKTALIMSLVCPDKVWLATGGKANFKESMLWPLLGHEVAVYPDADALHDWYARAVEMNRTLGTRLHIPTWYYNLMDHDEARREGLDLADVVLSF